MPSTSALFGLLALAASASAQDASACFTSGDLAGAVFIAVVLVLALIAAAYFAWRLYWRNKRGKHLVLVSDPEKGGDYAFDNPGFKEGTPITRTAATTKDETKVKWQNWGQVAALAAEGKPRALDDSFVVQPLRNMVPLRSHDFTGLGFNICGNMRDGIFVKDVLHRGPASESGRIVPGDRIESVRISFRHMVFEDALTILSYASPYEVQLEVENGASSRPATLLRDKRASRSPGPADRICHPFYRSHSISDLTKINKSSPSKWANESPMADMSNGDLSKPAIIETTPIEKMQKVGVRVLPSPVNNSLKVEAEKSQNARNSIIESGQVTSNNSLSNTPSKKEKSPINTMNKTKSTPSPRTKNAPVEDFDEIDLSDISHDKSSQEDGSRKNTPSPGLKESNVKSLLVKGLNNLKEKLHVGHKSERDPMSNDDDSKQKQQTEFVQTKNLAVSSNDNKINNATDILSEKVIQNYTEEVRDIPEEVQNAGNAARSNRKSMIEEGKNWDRPVSVVVDVQKATERSRKDSVSGGESSNEGDTTSQKKGKRKAPPPPQNKADESSGVIRTPSEVDEVDSKDSTSDKNTSMDSVDTDSEQGDKSGTTIELNSSHITVHHAPDSESNRKAASLGDLSRIGNDQPVVVLERAVSLDLADGTPGSGKKRKAPLPPQEEFTDDAGLNFSKEARLDNAVQTRLKHSSDFGRLEDAVKLNDNLSDDDTDPGVSELSTPEPDLQMLISSTPMKNVQNFFIPPTVNGIDSSINAGTVVESKTPPAMTSNLSTATGGVHVSRCSWDLSLPDTTTEQFVTAVNGNSTEDEDDVPPELPTSPIPTYVTEIQVVANKDSPGLVENVQSEIIGGNDIFPQSISEMSSFMTNNVHKPLTTFGSNHVSSFNSNNHFNMTPRRSEVSVINQTDDLSSLPTLTNLSDSMITEVNQVSLSQPNSLDPILQGESTTMNKEYRPPGTFVFSSENMSDEQILAMKSSPEPVLIDTSHNRAQMPKATKSNVSITSIRAGGSRIPVRAVPEPSQRKNSRKENYISFSSLNVTTPNDKKHTNGSGESSITHIVLNSQK